MRLWSRFLIVISALLIVVTYFFPLWRFELWAPQYPEGLFMQVWTFKLSGGVQNINILNHYVGMKPIEAENMIELKVFPYILGAFSLLGVIAAALGRSWIGRAWVSSLIIFCAIALADFYWWEYKFGHDLSEDAAIKMEDAVYQPPFIGSKSLLTITAKSYPAEGGAALSVAALLAIVAFFGCPKARGSNAN